MRGECVCVTCLVQRWTPNEGGKMNHTPSNEVLGITWKLLPSNCSVLYTTDWSTQDWPSSISFNPRHAFISLQPLKLYNNYDETMSEMWECFHEHIQSCILLLYQRSDKFIMSLLTTWTCLHGHITTNVFPVTHMVLIPQGITEPFTPKFGWIRIEPDWPS